MKILLISHAKNDENAGASRVYHMLASALRERGHEVKVYHLEDLRVPKLLNYVAMRLMLPEFMSWRFSKEAERGYDVVFCSNGMAWRIFRKLRAKSPRPYLIHHLHGLTYFDHLAVVTESLRGHVKLSPLVRALKGRFPIAWDAAGARYADAIVAQNLRDQDYLEDERSRHPPREGETPAPIYQVPLALHPSLDAASDQIVPPARRDPLSLLWFGSWRERKGNYYVNRAFREVKKKFPGARLTLGGTGAKPDEVAAFFDADLRSSVRVLPRIDVPTQVKEYNAHSIFIFPSLSEGFGLAPIEAMAMGLACVTTQTGVGSDWIEDGKHAVVVTMSSSEHLARGILRLVQDDALRVRVAEEGRKLAKSFTLERCTSDYLAIFERRAPRTAR